jgi:diaminohydroxyphosphoribosylaminopyrimidine deaminase/5-amino-6-(5-phosphoribosylamino)uracil reductase
MPKLAPMDSESSVWLTRAIDLARRSEGLASPNPMVGAVLLRAGHIVGEGHHTYAGLRHAEIIALQMAGKNARGSTLYINIEPCCTTGRTGPCTKALIAAGVDRVLAAMQDPNPAVSGRGFRELRKAGIEVEVADIGGHAHKLNESFAKWIRTGHPFVTLKTALTLDGQVALPREGRARPQPWITSEESRLEVHRMRHMSDAILTGIGTVLADDPQLTDRSGMQDPARSGLLGPDNPPRRRPLLRVILDTHLRIPPTSQLVRSAANDLLVLCGSHASSSKAAALGSLGVEVDQVPDYAGRLSLPAVLWNLAERDILSLLLECGSHLNGGFLRQNLVDKAILIYSETELGDQAIPFAQGIPSPYLFEQSLHRITRATYGPDVCITGYVHDPWPKQAGD